VGCVDSKTSETRSSEPKEKMWWGKMTLTKVAWTFLDMSCVAAWVGEICSMLTRRVKNFENLEFGSLEGRKCENSWNPKFQRSKVLKIRGPKSRSSKVPKPWNSDAWSSIVGINRGCWVVVDYWSTLLHEFVSLELWETAERYFEDLWNPKSQVSTYRASARPQPMVAWVGN